MGVLEAAVRVTSLQETARCKNKTGVSDLILASRFFFKIFSEEEVFVQKCSWDWMGAPCELTHCHLKGLRVSCRMLL